ncbi:hypothetical protein Vadar_009127 [Vaccinium darrowii]|uniref:Uncharacterized protein n=1 Tax=Vaccinium darrowii TaxID=229202 RepID=A0ACB7WZG0_9ERIC|nr:hypothetical protein Vadar_009127 [Vaccinium darrowii]
MFSNEKSCRCYDYYSDKQRKFDAPVPWVGVYIAVASLVCSVAMAGDVIYGIRRKKLWFPCKFFTMNAASLTLLAVATKLPVDLTTAMWYKTDVSAKLSSTVFVNTVMGNFLTSFASMDNNASLMNVVALGILVITIIVNACIQMVTTAIPTKILPEEKFVIISMLFLFVTLSFSVLTVPTTKRCLELKYDELHKTISNGGKLEETGKLIDLKLKEVVEKYWVMTETSSPQFVMARSVTCATSGIICLLTALTLVEVRIRVKHLNHWRGKESSYRWSTTWILWIQYCGVAVGTVASASRWFTAISFNRRNPCSGNHQNKLKVVEDYRIQRLIEWKERPLPLRIRGVKCRKLVEGTKNLALDLCIGVQYVIVVASKLVLFISTIFVLPFFSCYYYCKRLNMNLISGFSASSSHESSGPETSGTELDLSDYILQLEGEVKLPTKILKNLAHEVNKVIQMGRNQKPKYLIELLQKHNDGFKGVAGFDGSPVQNCWTLPVVTLTSIAIALPNTEICKVEWLIKSVSEGLSYARLVEKSLSTRGDDLLSRKHAVDVAWGGIELHGKWLDKDLRKLALEGKTTKEILQTLANIAEKTESSTNAGSSKFVVATSMRIISRTILKDYESSMNAHTDENLFEQLSIMIADILGACLTNLPRVIVLKCYCNAIEEREKSVRHAASLLGETEEILQILRGHQPPNFSGDVAAYIDEWRAFMKQKIPPAIFRSSNNETAASGELHLDVDE